MNKRKMIDTGQGLSDRVRNILIKNKSTIAVAESVTGGHLQAALSMAKDASLFFQGGITVYNIGQKCRHLHIEPIHAIETDCVSKKVSDQMAMAVCKMFSADYGIGITGYASLLPEKDIQSLFAFISISSKNKMLISKKITSTFMQPHEVQLYYTKQALKMCAAVLPK